MQSLDGDITAHNSTYVDRALERDKDYFDNILKQIDPNIQLDEEQRRAVITDDDYCLLVAGAGAGKTTTMAAKVKYLVEKKNIDPGEIIVISYTNKAIGELRDRINKGLGIPAKICTFHAFAYDIVKQFSAEPPEINFSSQQIIFDMLEKSIFHNKQLMRNLVLFLGYYFDLSEDVFKFTDLNQYHLYKAAQDFETLRSGLGEYIKKVEQQRTKKTRTISGEYLRSMQEVQIANFLYLNGLDYEYERVYPFGSPSRNKKYTPDFYISQAEHSVWLEHYALSESGYNSLFTPQQRQRYLRAISDKRRLHKTNKTTLLETWSFYTDRRPLLDHLKEVLENEGFILKLSAYFKQVKEVNTTCPDFYKTASDLKTTKPLIDISNYQERDTVLDYGIKRISRLKKTASLYLYKMFLEYRGRMPYTTINLTGYSIVTAIIKSEEKEHLTTVHIKLTSKRNKNQKDRTRLTWYVKREELQEAINAIVDGSLILESDDEYIELQGKGEIELSCGAASVILKKQIKDDMYTIDVNLKSIGEA